MSFDLARRNVLPRVNPAYHDNRDWVSGPSHIRRYAHASVDALLQGRAAFAYAAPKRINPGSQEKQNKDGVDRVNNQQQKDKGQSANDINISHMVASGIIDQANAGEKNGDAALKKAEANYKAHPNDKKAFNQLKGAQSLHRTADENGEFKKINAKNTEEKQDVKSIGDFNKKSNDKQNEEFNKNGDAKSAEQKAKEKAKAGFMKFLEIFGEIMSVLTIAFPGAGEVLSVGIRLGETVGKVAEDVAKVAKMAYKAEKFGDKIREVLNLKSGQQQIAGVSGKAMADLQKQLLGELIDLASKNIAATGKKIDETKRPKPKQNLPTCKGPRIQGCKPPKVRRSVVYFSA